MLFAAENGLLCSSMHRCSGISPSTGHEICSSENAALRDEDVLRFSLVGAPEDVADGALRVADPPRYLLEPDLINHLLKELSFHVCSSPLLARNPYSIS